MKILAVDDDSRILDMLRLILNQHDCEVDCATGADTALEMVKAHTYDFIFVDFRMPQKNGLWFMEHAHIPAETKVLLLTAFLSKELARKMFDMGISGYLTKPFDTDEILRHLSYYSHRHRLQ